MKNMDVLAVDMWIIFLLLFHLLHHYNVLTLDAEDLNRWKEIDSSY